MTGANELMQIQCNYREYFQSRFLTYGCHVKSLWGSSDSQYARFRIISEFGDLAGKSVLDVGCGFGDLFHFLKSNFVGQGKAISEYVGVDIVPGFVEEAKSRYPDADFIEGDILSLDLGRRFDVVVASGIFFMKHESWGSYVSSVLERMLDCANVGVVANFLSKHSLNPDGFSHYAAPGETLDLLMNKFSRKAVLRHDYLQNDFTVYLYK